MRVKSFKLGGHNIKVKYQKTVKDAEGNTLLGQANPMTNMILIATELNGHKLDEGVIEHSLYHELSHMILILMNQEELNGNEQFVDMLGMLFHQFQKTKR